MLRSAAEEALRDLSRRFSAVGREVRVFPNLLPEALDLEQVAVAAPLPAAEVVLPEAGFFLHRQAECAPDGLGRIARSLKRAGVERLGAGRELVRRVASDAFGLGLTVSSEGCVDGAVPHAVEVGGGLPVTDEGQNCVASGRVRIDRTRTDRTRTGFGPGRIPIHRTRFRRTCSGHGTRIIQASPRLCRSVPGGTDVNAKVIADYQAMMSDRVRMDAYLRAIERVCPGKTVCEIGVGLAPLTVMALRAGATRVYGIEADGEALAAAKRVVADNGFGPDRFVPIEGLSLDMELPERVDVLLCELFDSTGFAENVVTFVEDARQRHLKPAGVLLPRMLDCYVALAKPRAYDEFSEFWLDWLNREFALDYSSIMGRLRTHNVSLPIAQGELVSEWERWLHVDFPNPDASRRLDPVLLQVTQPSIVTGVAMVFDIELCEGIHIPHLPSGPAYALASGLLALLESGCVSGRRLSLARRDCAALGYAIPEVADPQSAPPAVRRR